MTENESFRGSQGAAESQLRRMRTAERLAYFQGFLHLVAYFLLSRVNQDWVTSLPILLAGILFGGLGNRVGKRQSARAAGLLIVLVVAEMVIGLVLGAQPFTLIIALFLWIYGQAFNAARKYARFA